jgi:glutamine amidotransferase
MQRLAIIDYGSGNLRSAAKAFERAALDGGLDMQIEVTADAEAVAQADRVVLPGVGAFADCFQGLTALPGMRAALEEAAVARTRPFFGICVGMQLMASRGLEHGASPGLDWIPGEVVPLAPSDPALKVPHMGWNALRVADPPHPVLNGLNAEAHVYFVHSYHMQPEDPACVAARVDYGGPVTAAVARDNLFGTQFHPEKSQATGLRIIGNFLRWRP